MTLNFTNALLR